MEKQKVLNINLGLGVFGIIASTTMILHSQDFLQTNAGILMFVLSVQTLLWGYVNPIKNITQERSDNG